MRHFLPLTSAELTESCPPNRQAQVADGRGLSGDESEELYETVGDEAAFCSLELVAAAAEVAKRRIVAVGPVAPKRWEDIESFLVDDFEAEDLIAEIRAAATQDELDAAVEELLALPLQWFDVSERPALAAALGA